MNTDYLKNLFIYNPDNGEIRWRENNNIAGSINKLGFRIIEHKGKCYRAHFIAWQIYYGEKGKEVHHVNGNRDDNRIINLRVFSLPESFKDVFKYDSQTGDLFWKIAPSRKVKVGDKAGCVCRTNKLVVILYNKKQYKAHRIAWELHHGYPPENEIDHINGNPADNRIKNLRDVLHSENQKNLKVSKASQTGVPGVRPNKERWEVTVGSRRVGIFDNFEIAVQMRQLTEELYGYHENHGKR